MLRNEIIKLVIYSSKKKLLQILVQNELSEQNAFI